MLQGHCSCPRRSRTLGVAELKFRGRMAAQAEASERILRGPVEC